MYAPMTTEMN